MGIVSTNMLLKGRSRVFVMVLHNTDTGIKVDANDTGIKVDANIVRIYNIINAGK